jgi:hypothetical protein
MRFLKKSEISDYTDKIWITQIFQKKGDERKKEDGSIFLDKKRGRLLALFEVKEFKG